MTVPWQTKKSSRFCERREWTDIRVLVEYTPELLRLLSVSQEDVDGKNHD